MAGGDQDIARICPPVFKVMGQNRTLVGGNGDGLTC